MAKEFKVEAHWEYGGPPTPEWDAMWDRLLKPRPKPDFA